MKSRQAARKASKASAADWMPNAVDPRASPGGRARSARGDGAAPAASPRRLQLLGTDVTAVDDDIP
eukprot:CAMPEP_0175477908 /NCGR_PEP_ID=MMETSP0095-20121207/76667_1 /TAXON_ID=311494 /ORGANISM="Alexandrium monilatum, Strain CCMP3105" /LENGTH=65 /DNA_ID=CAMNT_0016779505 /DNA_START=578 /DNA_END=773 /DNA_ORIENTATION=+